MTNIPALNELYAEYENDKRFQHLRPSNFVPGYGNSDAPIMLIGEAPGKVENEKRLPFQGESGMLLQELLNEAGISLEACFITNVLKFRPPNNRTPYEYEIVAALPYLKREIQIVNPQVIIALGSTPARVFVPSKPFSTLVGTAYQTSKYTIRFLNHPAFMLHPQVNPKMKKVRKMFVDTFREVKEFIEHEHG